VDPERLRRLLGARERTVLSHPSAVRCAVLVPLIADGDDYRVVYTVRTEHLPDHRGQVAFPGGKHCPTDETARHTALREAEEEVGLAPERVDVLGPLDDVYTMATHYVVTPIVGLVEPGSRFEPNPYEVADLFTMSIQDLLDPGRRATQPRTWKDQTFEVDVIKAGAHNIWVLTLNITKNLLDCVNRAAGD
jgi:8-oxo-dGTP pyrophosphatase MutT (NUDIX family)